MLRRAIVFCALGLCCCLPAFGQLRIVGPTDPVPASQPAWVWIEGLAETEGAMFWPETWLEVGPPHLQDLHAQFWTATEGKYQIKAVVVRIEMIGSRPVPVLIPLSFTVTVGEGPNPPPPPPPPPPAEELTGVLIYKAEDIDNKLTFAQLLVSTRIRDLDKFTLDPYDLDTLDEDDEVPTDLQPWLKLIKDNNWSLPRMLLINKNGDLVAHGSPQTIDAAISLIKENLK